MFLIFPYRIERPFRMPWATIAIMVTCVLVFVAQVALGLERSYQVIGFRPNAFGAITWLTSIFAHGGIMHLLGNMYFLWVFGGVLEDAIGRPKYVALYFAGGMVSTLVHSIMMLAFSPGEAFIPSLGASGAIAAIMGVAGVRFYKLKLSYWYFIWLLMFIRAGTFKLSAATGLALYFVSELFNGMIALALPGGGVAYWAHISGLVFGAAVALGFGFGKELDTEEAQAEARVYAAMGRHDLESVALANAPTADQAALHLARTRAAIDRGLADDPSTAAEASGAIRELLRTGRKLEARDAYLEFAYLSRAHGLLDAATLASVGSCCESIGDMENAAAAYGDVLRTQRVGPEAEKALYRLAHVYLAQGRHAEARQVWAAFLRHFPGSQWSAYGDERLAHGA